MVLVIARPQVVMSCVPWPYCDNMGEVLWEFTDDGCMPTSELYDPAYCYWPEIANPTFGSRNWDEPTEDSGWGGSYGQDLWTWSDGVFTVLAEDAIAQSIPERGDNTYLRQYLEVVHTLVPGLVESDPLWPIGLGIEIWNMSVYEENGWTGCPVGYENLAGDGYITGDYFPEAYQHYELGGGWYKTIWITNFAPDDSLGEDGINAGPGLHEEATHTACIVGMDLDPEAGQIFQIDEVHMTMVWYRDYGGGTYPDWLEQCSCLGIVIPPPPPGPPLEIVSDFDFLCEPQDPGGPPPQCQISGAVHIKLNWQPEEPDDVYVIIDPNPDSEVAPNPDLVLPASTEPNGVVRLIFNQSNYNLIQSVIFAAVADFEREGNENHIVSFSTQTSGDPNFDGYETLRSNPIIDNDIPFISVLPDGALMNVLTENNPGVPACVNVTLSHLPTSNVEIRGWLESEYDMESMVVMDPNFEDWTDPNHLLFTRDNYNVPQQICLKALDDDELAEPWLEWVGGVILLNGFSDDIWYQSEAEGGELEEVVVNFNVQDNDCGAWGYMHVDVNKDCYVNLGDVALLCTQWLFCTEPYDAGYNQWGNCDALWNLIDEEE